MTAHLSVNHPDPAEASPDLERNDDSPLLEKERLQALSAGRGQRLECEDSTIPELIQAHVRETPHHVALQCDGQQMTYEELWLRSMSLAERLREHAVVQGDFVGVCTTRSLEAPAAMLAVMILGAAYVPVDPSNPPQRMTSILADAGVRVVISDASSTEGWGDHVWTIVDASAVEPFEGEWLEPVAQPDDAAYVIYTSGSTGFPKGVVVEHRNVTALVQATAPLFRFRSSDVWSVFHSFAFDVSVFELWGALTTGGRAVVVPFWTSRDPLELHELLVSQQVTILSQTPSAFAQLVAELPYIESDAPLRAVILAGESLDRALLRDWFVRYPPSACMAVNMYGITETTVHCTASVMTSSDNSRDDIGLPLPGWEVHVLDPAGGPVRSGRVGELHVAGRGVTRGYLNRPELTAERFFYSHELEKRVYRSGDLGRRRPDGTLEYLGRLDDQVKVRGFRIELGEILSVLRSMPEIKDAAVVVDKGLAGSEAFIDAYLVSGADHLVRDELVTRVRDLVSQQLPSYMAPRSYTFVDALPLTVNGKLDRARLREVQQSCDPSRQGDGGA